MKQIILTDSGPESRASQIDREIEGLVSGFVEAPTQKASDSLFYLTRERAMLLRKTRRVDENDNRPRQGRHRRMAIAL
ncbi:hypothetical protein ACFYE9_07335 [Rhizobium leguminosarum]|uniref:Uncharacterized protein n=2 Tax=Rhizobium leguminosarum TaxID=384 RepID=A0A154IFV6_RHILE|nr:hypothetical protein [Rhizobium leguminosarum]KZA99291.1 hypothetical protein A4A59_23040 [Rhizobium leguminosarum]